MTTGKKEVIDLKNVLEKSVSFFLVDALKYQNTILKILKIKLKDNKHKGIYVALNKPHQTLSKFFEENQINSKDLYFIDTNYESNEELSNVAFLDAENISGIQDKIKELIDTGKFDFIIFDTIDTFLLYNNKKIIYKFFRSVVNNIRKKGQKCIFIGIKEALLEHMLHVSIETISDEVVDLVQSSTEKFEATFIKL